MAKSMHDEQINSRLRSGKALFIENFEQKVDGAVVIDTVGMHNLGYLTWGGEDQDEDEDGAVNETGTTRLGAGAAGGRGGGEEDGGVGKRGRQA